MNEAQFSDVERKTPTKPRNLDRRPREYLYTHEVELLRKSAKINGQPRLSNRNSTLILMMFRHAFRVGEVITLKWAQIDFTLGFLHVNRLKDGMSSTHPINGDEIRALRKLRRDFPDCPYVFVSRLNAPLTARGVHRIIENAAIAAKMEFPVHPHMLRHSTGYYLANKGHDTRSIQAYMGHKNINSTVLYTQLGPGRFNNFWKD